ncbi:MAG: alpha/beta hydrolase-fold protein [Anaerolineales bacterium]|nr:alpha/beta hydrolase-fold protein [Anaerolineales bacterium]
MRGSQAALVLVSAVLAGLSACAPVVTPTLPVTFSPSPLVSPVSPTSAPLPLFTPSPMTDCLAIPAQVETDSLPSQSLAETLEFIIYLPPCYDEHVSQHYPVLYLLHGQTYTNDQWVRLGAPATADRLIAAGDAPPFIIVMPHDPSWKQPTEYGFAEALTEELIPYVDAHYRTIASREQRAIGGLSRGAGWAIHFGLTRPDLFGAFGAHSPVVFWTDGPHLGEWLKAIPPESLPRIYLDIGDNDRELETALELEDILDQQNIPHEWHLYPGFHEESYWQAHVEEYLRWYAAEWH